MATRSVILSARLSDSRTLHYTALRVFFTLPNVYLKRVLIYSFQRNTPFVFSDRLLCFFRELYCSDVTRLGVTTCVRPWIKIFIKIKLWHLLCTSFTGRCVVAIGQTFQLLPPFQANNWQRTCYVDSAFLSPSGSPFRPVVAWPYKLGISDHQTTTSDCLQEKHHHCRQTVVYARNLVMVRLSIYYIIIHNFDRSCFRGLPNHITACCHKWIYTVLSGLCFIPSRCMCLNV